MGIDVYLRWPGQTEAERQAQVTGFSIVHGHVGYLREAYHGEPYATKVLIPEGWAVTLSDEAPSDAEDRGVIVAAATLRERLPATIEAAITRGRAVYNETLCDKSPEVRTYEDFVALAERKERETGGPIRIIVSA